MTKRGFEVNKKYELIDTEYVFNFLGKKLFRIRALVDIKFYDIKAGDKGGYIESERCLSVEGNAWVYGNAQVSSLHLCLLGLTRLGPKENCRPQACIQSHTFLSPRRKGLLACGN